MREVVEEVAFQARQDQKVDKRSGVSQRLPISLLENVVSNAERRALPPAKRSRCRASPTSTRRIPAITGKFELEYEGELKGADNVAREMIRSAVAIVFDGWFPNADLRQVTEWFDLGGNLQVDDALPAAELVARDGAACRGCTSGARGGSRRSARANRTLASAIDFVLEGMYAQTQDQPLRRRASSRAGRTAQARRAADDGSADRAGAAADRRARRSITTRTVIARTKAKLTTAE